MGYHGSNATDCAPCAAGYFKDFIGAGVCAPCAEGYWKDWVGEGLCTNRCEATTNIALASNGGVGYAPRAQVRPSPPVLVLEPFDTFKEIPIVKSSGLLV